MVSKLFSRDFVRDAAERAVRAFATSSLALLASDRIVGVFDIDLDEWASVSGLAVLISLLTSLAGTRFGDDSASFVSK